MSRSAQSILTQFVVLSSCWLAGRTLATDYFLTIGGGYSPQGNQASLEANVTFFQQVLAEKHAGPRSIATFFADGYNDRADVQVLKPDQASKTPATDFLASLFSFRGSSPEVEYRNHRVGDIAGPIDPANIEAGLKRFATHMQTGDRLLVYVTAHGSPAKGKNRHNTSISCWDGKSISETQFSRWLDEVPKQVPVIMVMAQCYCGGFSHTIFNGGNMQNGLSDHLRVGFFAQQFDLAAAGCRPDIENDAEYSSFFWGALTGRTRNGVDITSADLDANGRISFAEAHAHAVLASETIDIPIRTSEALLRIYSRIGDYDLGEKEDEVLAEDSSLQDDAWSLCQMTGRLDHLIEDAHLDQKRIVEGLARQLGIPMESEVTEVFNRFDETKSNFQNVRRGTFRGRRGRSSGGRELRDEIAQLWPELGERETWRQSELLREDNQQALFEKLQQLSSYQAYMDSRKQRQQSQADAESAEIVQVKYQRLINTLEAIVLDKNLSRIAKEDVVQRYREIVRVEESFLQPN